MVLSIIKVYTIKYQLMLDLPMKNYAPILLLLLLIPTASAFSYTSHGFNYITPTGGTLLYGLDYTATSWNITGNRFTWGETVYGGTDIGTIGFDPSVGALMNVTNLEQLVLNYTVTAIGVRTQRIYYRGLGAPDSVDGGTSATAGTVTTVTTNGNATVGIVWSAPAPPAGGGAGFSVLIIPIVIMATLTMAVLSRRR